MKKNFLSVVALIIAIAASSFTVVNDMVKEDLYTFEYRGPSPATVSDVQNEANYAYVGMDEPDCAGAEEACRVNVPATHVNGTALKTSANISATLTATSARINGVAAGSYSNQP